MLDGVVPPLLVGSVGALLIVVRQLSGRPQGPRRLLRDLVIVMTIVGTAMLLEFEMGRTPTYRHGPVRIWSGDVTSDQNSQQLFDPYSFTHLIHGAAFYALTRPVMAASSFGLCAIVVVSLESAWETYENTNQVIKRYRSKTASQGYSGDSMINSFFDIVSCSVGFLLAWRRRAWLTLSWVVAIELALAWWIRDNLTLNILMLVYPIKAIKAWQLGA